MSKYIKVSGCHDCDYGGGYVCDKLWITQPDNARIHKYKISKTIHPDCPLDDDMQQALRDKLKARDEYIGQIEQRTIKKGGLLRIAEKRIKELEGERDA
jgi:hypothetical protein